MLIKELKPNQIFVFGSNEAGRHGRGAAFTAKKWGAKNGVGVGLMGQTYGIPTKDRNIKTLPLGKIRKYVEEFLEFAKGRPDLEFLTTNIGCGLAGFQPKQIAPMFKTRTSNVILSQEFIENIGDLNYEIRRDNSPIL